MKGLNPWLKVNLMCLVGESLLTFLVYVSHNSILVSMPSYEEREFWLNHKLFEIKKKKNYYIHLNVRAVLNGI